MFWLNNKKGTNKTFKIRFIFSKTGLMRYVSHLDLIRLFMRAGRRAVLPLYFTEGFNPHPKLIIKRALKLGVESESEEAEIILVRRMNPGIFKDRLNKQLPQGIRIKQAQNLN